VLGSEESKGSEEGSGTSHPNIARGNSGLLRDVDNVEVDDGDLVVGGGLTLGSKDAADGGWIS
jgi:hypothetical protein